MSATPYEGGMLRRKNEKKRSDAANDEPAADKDGTGKARILARIISPRADRPAKLRGPEVRRHGRWNVPEESNRKTPAAAAPAPARAGGGVEQISLATAAYDGVEPAG